MAVVDKGARVANRNRVASKTDKRKQSFYFQESMLHEIVKEAARLDWSLSAVVQRAWKISCDEIRKLPNRSGDDDNEE